MNDRDCESCKKFSRTDPYESEGYCDAKRSWVDPQEGEECKMHEFTLHSATKYDDGTPIMSEPEKTYCKSDADLIHGIVDSASKTSEPEMDINSSYPTSMFPKSNQLDAKYCSLGRCPYYDKFCDHTLKDKHGCAYLPHNTGANLEYLEQVYTEFAKTQDDFIEEYDATLKTHGDTLEQHMERITINEGNIDAISSDVEDLQRKVYQIYQFLNSIDPDFFAKIEEQIHSEPPKHNCNNFCGNCTHASHVAPDEMWRCILSGEPVDPDDSSCSMFEPPF